MLSRSVLPPKKQHPERASRSAFTKSYACSLRANEPTNTCAYLAAKSKEERRAIIAQARRDVLGLRKLYKERQAEIQRVRRENLEAERKEKERKEQARLAELERLVKAVELLGGQWRSVEAVELGLGRLTTGKRGENKPKLDAIKTQINFRKKVLS